MLPIDQIHFKNRQASKVEVASQNSLPQALKNLGLEKNLPVIVLIGGAGGVREEDFQAIGAVIEIIAEIAQTAQAAVIDGGTQSGIMAAIGQIRARNNFQFPLIGVSAIDTVTWPKRPGSLLQRFRDSRAQLDPNHSHFILVPGENWGDESSWIAETATQLAGAKPSLAVLINGGQISRDRDIPNNLKAGRPVWVIEGTGRAADELATFPPDTALMRFIHISEPERLSAKLREYLQPVHEIIEK